LWVFIEGRNATVGFVQRYQDPKVLDIGEKTLVLVNSKDKWRIISEEWKPLAMSVQTTGTQVAPLSQKKSTSDNRPSDTLSGKLRLAPKRRIKPLLKALK